MTAEGLGTLAAMVDLSPRLRRLAEIGDIDLDDPELRFSLMLQQRLFAAGSAGIR